jgi:hypothetical protein
MTNWTSYATERPPAGIVCRFRQPVYPKARPLCDEDMWIGTVEELRYVREINTAGLYWQLTGVGRMQMGETI